MLGCLKFTRIQELSPCLTWWRSASQLISIFFCQKYLKFDLKRFWQKCSPYSSSVSKFTNIRHHLMTDMNYQAPSDCWVIIFLSKLLPTISTFLKILHSLKSTVFVSERISGEQLFIIYRSSWNNLVKQWIVRWTLSNWLTATWPTMIGRLSSELIILNKGIGYWAVLCNSQFILNFLLPSSHLKSFGPPTQGKQQKIRVWWRGGCTWMGT